MFLGGPYDSLDLRKEVFLHVRERDHLPLIIPSSFTWERVTGVLVGERGAEVLLHFDKELWIDYAFSLHFWS